MDKFKIAFCGWAGTGKTESAKYISYKYDGSVISFADGIKFIDRYLFGLGRQDRERLKMIGEFFRTIDNDIWVKRTIETADYEDRALIDDLKSQNEFEALKKAGFKIIRLVTDDNIRIERLKKRDEKFVVSLMYDESEAKCSNHEVLEIKNNGTLDELFEKLDVLMEQYMFYR